MLQESMELCARHNYADLSARLRLVADMHEEVLVLAAAAEEANNAKCLALAMGHHARLGGGSALRYIDIEVLRLVLATAGLRGV